MLRSIWKTVEWIVCLFLPDEPEGDERSKHQETYDAEPHGSSPDYGPRQTYTDEIAQSLQDNENYTSLDTYDKLTND